MRVLATRILRSVCVVSTVFISNAAFAERNPNVSEACAQFKINSAKPPTDEVTFKYYNGLPAPIFRTYYKDPSSSSIYYSSPENREIKQAPMTSRGDIFAHPLENISFKEYQSFFTACGIIPDDELLPDFSFYLLEAGGSDQIVAAKALQDSEWFEIVFPNFITGTEDP